MSKCTMRIQGKQRKPCQRTLCKFNGADSFCTIDFVHEPTGLESKEMKQKQKMADGAEICGECYSDMEERHDGQQRYYFACPNPDCKPKTTGTEDE